MSTKLYNGYRVDTRDVPAFTAAVHAAVAPAYLRQYVRTAARIAAHGLDRAWALGEPPQPGPGPSPLRAAFIEIADAQDTIEKTSRRNPPFDMQVEVAIYAEPTGPLYVRLFTEQDALTAAFETVPGVTPWPYWNNTDQPDDVTAAEWTERAHTWERVMAAANYGPDGMPGRGPLVWKLAPSWWGPDDSTVTRLLPDVMPTRAERAKLIAPYVVDKTPLGDPFDRNGSVGRFMDALRVAAAEKEAELVRSLPDLTVADLTRQPTPTGSSS